MIANQSYLNGDPRHQAVLDVFVGEPGLPEMIPKRAGLKPAKRRPASAQASSSGSS